MLQQTMEQFKKCSAILRGDADVDDVTIKSPLLEMNRLSSEVYRYTGLVKVSCPVLSKSHCKPIIRIIRHATRTSCMH